MTTTRIFGIGDDRFGVTSGDYELSFLDGNDRLVMRGGSATAYMGAGNDFVRIYGGSARVFGQAGDDRFDIFGTAARVNGGSGNDSFVIGGGDDHVLVGREGDDRFHFTAGTVNVLVQADGGNDTFYGNSQAISGNIFGGDGNDRYLMFGNFEGRGAVLYGGPGDDLYRIDPHSPPIIVEYAGEGVDTVQVADGVTYTLGANLENVMVGAFSQVGEGVTLTGNELANRISGSQNVDVIDGSAGDDVLFGLGGNDYIVAGDGNDRLIGGAGIDQMLGGSGDDIFAYLSAGDAPYDYTYSSSDWIFDFESGDRIDLSAIDANSEIPGVQHFTVVQGDGHAAGTLHYSGDPGGWGWTTILGYIDGDDQPDLMILVTSYIDGSNQGYPPITPDSFILG